MTNTPPSITRHQELSDTDVDRASNEALRAAYRSLRDHRGAETSAEIMEDDARTLARLSEIIDFMRNHYSPIGGRSCALCVYEEGRFIRSCKVHLWEDAAKRIFATRADAPDDPTTTDHLSDRELFVWANRAGLYEDDLRDTCVRLIVDELRDRRAAEAIFVELDRQFQDIVDCDGCSRGGPDGCTEHEDLIRAWRNARRA